VVFGYALMTRRRNLSRTTLTRGISNTDQRLSHQLGFYLHQRQYDHEIWDGVAWVSFLLGRQPFYHQATIDTI
jgi:hypothetical protein